MADEEKTEAAAETPAEAPAAEAPKEEKKAKAKKTSSSLDSIIESIKGLSVMELADLVKALEEEFGVSAAAPVAVAAAPAAGGAAAEEVEEKTEFTVVLKEIGANKINVIKAVRELTSLGLKESKDLVEAAPSNIKENINKDDAAAAKTKLEAAGATVEIK